MKKSSKNIIGLALSVAFLLTSCAGDTAEPVKDPEPSATLHETQAPVEVPEPEVVEEPEPAPEPEPEPEFVAGQVVDEVPEDLPEGVVIYEMPDGELITILRDEPLPKKVRKHIQAKVDEIPEFKGPIQGEPGNENNNGKIDSAAQQVAKFEHFDTGKNIVVLYKMVGSCGNLDNQRLGWANSFDGYPKYEYLCGTYDTLAEALEYAEAQIDKFGNPERYEVFIWRNEKP